MTTVEEKEGAEGEYVIEASRSSPKQQVVTVFAPKGGSGATVLAVNLAVALHAAGQRVCLVDLDLEFGDVGVSLRLDPVRSIADAVEVTPLHDLAAELLTEFEPGFDCVLAPIDPGAADDLPPTVVNRLLIQLRSTYDFVIVDTQQRFSDHVLAAIDESDHLLLVATPEITSLKSVRLSLDVLDLLDHPRSARHLVLQKDGVPSGLAADEVSTALDLALAAVIPCDDAVTTSINDGTPLLLSGVAPAVGAAIRDYAVRAFVPDVPEAAAADGRRTRRFRRKS